MHYFKFLLLIIFSYSTTVSSQDDLSQNRIIHRIKEYIRDQGLELSNDDLDYRGVCFGLTTTWLYANYLSDQEKTTNAEIDNLDFFNKTVSLIADKNSIFYDAQTKLEDNERKLEDNEKKNINRLINHIVFFQSWATKGSISENFKEGGLEEARFQKDIDKSLEDTKGRKLNEIFSETIVGNEEILKKRLKYLTINSGDFVFISSLLLDVENPEGHAVGLYKNKKGEICIYDSNARSGAKKFKTLTELYQYNWSEGLLEKHRANLDIFDIGIKIYSFERKSFQNTWNIFLNEEECKSFKTLLEEHEKKRTNSSLPKAERDLEDSLELKILKKLGRYEEPVFKSLQAKRVLENSKWLENLIKYGHEPLFKSLEKEIIQKVQNENKIQETEIDFEKSDYAVSDYTKAYNEKAQNKIEAEKFIEEFVDEHKKNPNSENSFEKVKAFAKSDLLKYNTNPNILSDLIIKNESLIFSENQSINIIYCLSKNGFFKENVRENLEKVKDYYYFEKDEPLNFYVSNEKENNNNFVSKKFSDMHRIFRIACINGYKEFIKSLVAPIITKHFDYHHFSNILEFYGVNSDKNWLERCIYEMLGTKYSGKEKEIYALIRHNSKIYGVKDNFEETLPKYNQITKLYGNFPDLDINDYEIEKIKRENFKNELKIGSKDYYKKLILSDYNRSNDKDNFFNNFVQSHFEKPKKANEILALFETKIFQDLKIANQYSLFNLLYPKGNSVFQESEIKSLIQSFDNAQNLKFDNIIKEDQINKDKFNPEKFFDLKKITFNEVKDLIKSNLIDHNNINILKNFISISGIYIFPELEIIDLFKEISDKAKNFHTEITSSLDKTFFDLALMNGYEELIKEIQNNDKTRVPRLSEILKKVFYKKDVEKQKSIFHFLYNHKYNQNELTINQTLINQIIQINPDSAKYFKDKKYKSEK